MHLVPFQSPILEQTGDLPLLIKHLSEALLHHRRNDASPMVSLAIPYIEETALLHSFVSRICDAFDRQGFAEDENPDPCLHRILTINTLSDRRFLERHAGPVIVNIPNIIWPTSDNWIEIWQDLQRDLIANQRIRFSLLLAGQELGAVAKTHPFFLKELFKKNYRSFHWPDPENRSCSVKRDYFIHFVHEKRPVIAEAIRQNQEVCALLRKTLKQLPIDEVWIARLKDHARNYLNQVGSSNDLDHSIKVLETYLENLLRQSPTKKVSAA